MTEAEVVDIELRTRFGQICTRLLDDLQCRMSPLRTRLAGREYP
jgi:hypothetical protein